MFRFYIILAIFVAIFNFTTYSQQITIVSPSPNNGATLTDPPTLKFHTTTNGCYVFVISSTSSGCRANSGVWSTSLATMYSGQYYQFSVPQSTWNSLSENTIYYWHISYRIVNCPELPLPRYSDCRTFTKSSCSAPSGSPTAISPCGGKNISELRPTLNWNGSYGYGIYYHVQVSTNSSFSNIVSETADLTYRDNSWKILSNLNNNTTYFWRLRAEKCSPRKYGTWSNICYFNIVQPPTLSLKYPKGGETFDCGSNLNVQWTSKNINNIKVEFHDGTNWNIKSSSIPANNGSYSFILPSLSNDITNCKVRISDASNSSLSRESDNFTVKKCDDKPCKKIHAGKGQKEAEPVFTGTFYQPPISDGSGFLSFTANDIWQSWEKRISEPRELFENAKFLTANVSYSYDIKILNLKAFYEGKEFGCKKESGGQVTLQNPEFKQNDEYTYNIIMKPSTIIGVVSAFFLHRIDDNTNNPQVCDNNHEIDIEVLRKSDNSLRCYFTTWTRAVNPWDSCQLNNTKWDDRRQEANFIYLNDKYCNEFHKYSFKWTKSYVDFYIDDVFIVRHNTIVPFKKAPLKINTWSNIGWAGLPENTQNYEGTTQVKKVWISTIQTPITIFPANGAQNIIDNITFIWNKVTSAIRYHLQVSEGPFSSSEIKKDDEILSLSLIVNDSTITDTTYTLNDLKENQKYYWRVKAIKSESISGLWSDTLNFSTKNSSGCECDFKPELILAATDSEINSVDVNTYNNNIFAVLGRKLMRSDDQGNSWDQVYDFPYDLDYLRFPFSFHKFNDSNYVFAGGMENGYIARSLNNGDIGSWELIKLPGNEEYRRIFSLLNTNNYLFAGTQNQGIYRSSNFGIAWVKVNNGLARNDSSMPYIITRLLETKESNIIASSHGIGIFKSIDNGNNWSNIAKNISTNYLVYNKKNGTFFAGPNASYKRVYRSLDGINWHVIKKFDGMEYIEDIVVYNANYVFLITAIKIINSNWEEKIYLSCDNGNNWSILYKDTLTSHKIQMVYDSSGNIYLSNSKGIFRDSNCKKTLLSSIISIEDNNKHSIIFIYPNPSHSEAKINIKLEEAENIILKIYDLNGRELETIINKYMESGEHTIIHNISKLSSGEYFYNIKIGDQIKSEKLILLR